MISWGNSYRRVRLSEFEQEFRWMDNIKASNMTRSQNQRKLLLTKDYHRIKSLPGLQSSQLNQFSGYLPVDDSGIGQLFYWLIEAETNPEKGKFYFILFYFILVLKEW
jgi:hypothetical protein